MTRRNGLAALLAAAFALAPLGAASLAQTPPATKPPAAAGKSPKKPKKPRVPRPVAQVQQLMGGKLLSDTQRKAVVAAAKERDAAMKPIRDRYRAKVAKALGITPAQLEAKEKALRTKQQQRAGA